MDAFTKTSPLHTQALLATIAQLQHNRLNRVPLPDWTAEHLDCLRPALRPFVDSLGTPSFKEFDEMIAKAPLHPAVRSTHPLHLARTDSSERMLRVCCDRVTSKLSELHISRPWFKYRDVELPDVSQSTLRSTTPNAFADYLSPDSPFQAPSSNTPMASSMPLVTSSSPFTSQFSLLTPIMSPLSTSSTSLSSPGSTTSVSSGSSQTTEAIEVDPPEDKVMVEATEGLQEPSEKDRVMTDAVGELQGQVEAGDKMDVAEEERPIQDGAAMEGVRTSPQSSSPQPPLQIVGTTSSKLSIESKLAAMPDAPAPALRNLTFDDEIWKKLDKAASKLRISLRGKHELVQEKIQQLTPAIDLAVVHELVRRIKQSHDAVAALKNHFFRRNISLEEVKAIWSCIEQSLAKQESTPAPPTPLASASDNAAPPPRNHVPFAGQGVVPGAQLPLDLECVVGMLKRARDYVRNSSYAQEIAMFELPWTNKVVMEKVAKFIINHPKWGNGDFSTAKTKIESEYSGGAANNVPNLLWTCRLHLHRLELQPTPAIGRCAFAKERPYGVRALFSEIAGSTFASIECGLPCLSWGEMQDLAKNKEYRFHESTIGTSRPRDVRAYGKFVEAQQALWRDPKNMREHMRALQPVASSAANRSAPPRKRGQQQDSASGVEVPGSKRVREIPAAESIVPDTSASASSQRSAELKRSRQDETSGAKRARS